MKLVWLTAMIAVTGLPRFNNAQCPPSDHPIINGPTGARIDSALTRLEVFGYSGAMLIAKNGNVILRKAYGWADRPRRIRNTTETPFEISVATTPLTAATVLALVEDRKLKLTDSIGRFFPTLPPQIRGVTVEQLLTHMGGAPSSVTGTSASRDDAIARIVAATWQGGPPTFRYSNAGYVMLAAVIDEVTGGYRNYMSSRVLEPLGMRGTFFRGQRVPQSTCVARGYSGARDVSTAAADTSWSSLGATHLVSTVDDLYAWGKSWPRGLFDRRWVFNDSAFYGFGGVTRLTSRGTRYLHAFSGGNPGYQTEVAAFPEDGVVWSSVSNASDAGGRSIGFTAQAYALDALFGGNLGVPPVASLVDDATSRALAGAYRLASGGRVVIRGAGDSLIVAAVGKDAAEALDSPVDPARPADDTTEIGVRPLRRTADGAFVGWDIARGRGVRIESSGAGRLTIRRGDGTSVVATR